MLVYERECVHCETFAAFVESPLANMPRNIRLVQHDEASSLYSVVTEYMKVI